MERWKWKYELFAKKGRSRNGGFTLDYLYDAYVSLMDDEIREEIHMEMEDDLSMVDFLTEYKKRHLEHFKEEFQI